jgi:ATPase subunit of ABC transporter with duplicated ATPase domains
MLTVHSLSKSYGIDTIFQDVSFNLNAGERLGLVGPNGCGKTTLLRILAGEERPDAGGFHFSPPGLSLGYLPQGLNPVPGETLAAFLDCQTGELLTAGMRLEELAAGLAATPDDSGLQQAYDLALTQLPLAAQLQSQAGVVLMALGLGDLPPETPVENLSGGQKTRLALAGVLLSSPQVLLLDEPTNHLDIGMLEWLEDWLVDSPLTRNAAVLIVSHDRAFLDQTVTGILEMDPKNRSLRAYPGNYSAYVEQKLAERERHWQSYTDQQEEIVRLRQAAELVRGQAVFRKGGKADTGDKFAKGFFANRSRGTVKRAKNIEQRLEKLLTDERIEKPRQSWQMKLDLRGAPASGRDVIVLEGLSVGYDNRPLLSELSLQVRYGQRIALIGPNGAGKTTLLRTISGALPPIAGRARLGSAVRVGYMAQEQETLDPGSDALSILRSLAPYNETEARAFLHQFLFSGDEVFTQVSKLSYGERARLLLACLVASGCNLLLLDEPINHLDVPSRARFEQALANFDGTVLAVVHDRYFIQGFASEIWEIESGKLQVWR